MFTSDSILDFNFVRPVLIDLLDLLATEVDVLELFASIFLGGSTGVSLNGTFGSVVTWGGRSLVDL